MSISRIVTSIIHTNIIVDTTTNIVDTSIYINIFPPSIGVDDEVGHDGEVVGQDGQRLGDVEAHQLLHRPLVARCLPGHLAMLLDCTL